MAGDDWMRSFLDINSDIALRIPQATFIQREIYDCLSNKIFSDTITKFIMAMNLATLYVTN
ncbi:hypothetical protein LSH36_133g02038 [Paralvinella palmiformis]|uniref:Uncharacterized protein n=1 Tax=Paralvinella palmiformis TaxID=53620 RepID=A0AAD9JW87_9ANNE|nr:hypothetical protein LSH36_133g02038 [Paralvinella palmiformis]